MCIAVPMKVVAAEQFSATCESGSRREDVNTELVGEVSPGEWLLVFRGSAQRKMDEDEARMTLSALNALADVLEGTATQEGVDDAFSDITAHTGELPPHLAALAAKGRQHAEN